MSHNSPMAALVESPETLLAALTDAKLCSTALSNRVYAILVQPFKESTSSTVGGSSLKATAKPAATTTKRATTKTKIKVSADGDQKKLTTQLAPLAMRIVNQNLQTISRLLMSRDPKPHSTVIVNDGDMQVVMQCLADTSLYAVTALQYMEPYLTMKPLDIEKALSNVITKIIEIGMVCALFLLSCIQLFVQFRWLVTFITITNSFHVCELYLHYSTNELCKNCHV